MWPYPGKQPEQLPYFENVTISTPYIGASHQWVKLSDVKQQPKGLNPIIAIWSINEEVWAYVIIKYAINSYDCSADYKAAWTRRRT